MGRSHIRIKATGCIVHPVDLTKPCKRPSVEKSGQLKVLGQSSMKSLQRPHGNETKYERPRLKSPSKKGSSCSCHLLRFPLARIHCSGRVEGQSDG